MATKQHTAAHHAPFPDAERVNVALNCIDRASRLALGLSHLNVDEDDHSDTHEHFRVVVQALAARISKLTMAASTMLGDEMETVETAEAVLHG